LGLGLGAIVFRVKGMRGELFALLTLAVTFVVGTVILNTPIDGGNGCLPGRGRHPQARPHAVGHASTCWRWPLPVTLLVAWGSCRAGRGLFAIHDDEDAAEVMGVPTYRYKLRLAISCALAGVAGGIHALFVST
jgi:branched-chain amino acid transport system permease protein